MPKKKLSTFFEYLERPDNFSNSYLRIEELLIFFSSIFIFLANEISVRKFYSIFGEGLYTYSEKS